MATLSGGNPPKLPLPTQVGGVPTPGPGGLGTGAIKQSGGSPSRLPLGTAPAAPILSGGAPPELGGPTGRVNAPGPGRPASAPSNSIGNDAARGRGSWAGHSDQGGGGHMLTHPTPVDTTSTTHGNGFGTNAHTLASVAQATGVASGQHKAHT